MLYTYKQLLLKNKELKDRLVQTAAELVNAEEALNFKCCGCMYSDKFRMLLFIYLKKIDAGYQLLITDGHYKQIIDIHSLNILDFMAQPVKVEMQLLFNKDDFISRITEGGTN